MGHDPSGFGKQCLITRRLVKRGVRFVQIYHGRGKGWDSHTKNDQNQVKLMREIDKPISGLLTDLKRSGLLDNTRVVWGGEFGRTPTTEGAAGRDHWPFGYTMWLAGAGIKGGQVIGATDEFGFLAVEDKVHVNDLHATIFKLLDLDHEQLTYLFQGRQQRLTDVGGHKEIVDRLLA